MVHRERALCPRRGLSWTGSGVRDRRRIAACRGSTRAHTPWRDVVANFANYGTHLVTQALLAAWAIDAWDLSAGDAILPVLVVAIYQYGVVASFLLNGAYGALAYGESIREEFRKEWRLQLAAEPPIAIATGLTAYIYGTAGAGALAVLVALQLIFIFLARELRVSHDRAETLKERTEQLLQLHENLAGHAGRISDLSASRGRLVGQILAAEEGERRRLDEALHDEAMQNLLAARQDLESVVGPVDVARARTALDAAIDQTSRGNLRATSSGARAGWARGGRGSGSRSARTACRFSHRRRCGTVRSGGPRRPGVHHLP